MALRAVVGPRSIAVRLSSFWLEFRRCEHYLRVYSLEFYDIPAKAGIDGRFRLNDLETCK